MDFRESGVPLGLGVLVAAVPYAFQASPKSEIAARLLATYLIPGCVERGVRLGSECLSAVSAGVQKAGNVGI